MRRSRTSGEGSAALLLLLAGAVAIPGDLRAQDPDVPFVPTPMEVVSTMLEIARPTPGDTLYDLGSGDGRLVVEAAARYGTTGVGVEIQERLNEDARERARAAGVEPLVRFLNEDLFDVDLRPATVLTLYLSRPINFQLRPRVLRQLRPGARVVSHAFDMGQWGADTVIPMPEEAAVVYMWTVPAHVAGTWHLGLPSGEEVVVGLDQKFQEVRVVRVTGPEGLAVEDPVLEGDSLRFDLVCAAGADDGRRRSLEGVVRGDRLRGSTPSGEAWSAHRTEGGDRPLDEWTYGAPPGSESGTGRESPAAGAADPDQRRSDGAGSPRSSSPPSVAFARRCSSTF